MGFPQICGSAIADGGDNDLSILWWQRCFDEILRDIGNLIPNIIGKIYI